MMTTTPGTTTTGTTTTPGTTPTTGTISNAYPYYKYVATPAELHMSSRGTIQTMTNNIAGLTSYVELLVSGKSAASKTGQPLGNKYFLNTGGQCKATTEGPLQDRYMYINNQPQGNIPFLSSGLGVNFTDMRGLIPGVLSDTENLNPERLFQAFTMGATPDCQSVTLQTVTVDNQVGQETHYVALADLANLDPCTFSNGINPVTKQKCKETFGTREGENNESALQRFVTRALCATVLLLLLLRFLSLA